MNTPPTTANSRAMLHLARSDTQSGPPCSMTGHSVIITVFSPERPSWPEEWFSQTPVGEKPWLFSMSDEFIGHCLQTIDGILDGVGAYARSHQTEK